jgi:hypothetical protein
VLDTNLLVPGLIGAAREQPAATATAALVRAAEARAISLLVSDPFLVEVDRVRFTLFRRPPHPTEMRI